MRTFDTGATRDTSHEKLDFMGYLSPQVLNRYAEYMYYHQRQADGQWRSGDNWKKGIPLDVYLGSLLRHVIHLWECHEERRGYEESEEALCAIMFNTMGYLYQMIQETINTQHGTTRIEEGQ